MLAYNRLVPAAIRAHLRKHTRDYQTVLQSLKLPVRVIHGELDAINLLAMSQHTTTHVPQAQLTVYEGVAHTPFWEAPARFNAELAQFVRDCQS
jgi:hypothetical protein